MRVGRRVSHTHRPAGKFKIIYNQAQFKSNLMLGCSHSIPICTCFKFQSVQHSTGAVYLHANTLHCPVDEESLWIIADSIEPAVMTVT